jgi:hypothetical protein
MASLAFHKGNYKERGVNPPLKSRVSASLRSTSALSLRSGHALDFNTPFLYSNYRAFSESPSFLFWVEQRLTGYLVFLHYQAQKEKTISALSSFTDTGGAANRLNRKKRVATSRTIVKQIA